MAEGVADSETGEREALRVAGPVGEGVRSADRRGVGEGEAPAPALPLTAGEAPREGETEAELELEDEALKGAEGAGGAAVPPAEAAALTDATDCDGEPLRVGEVVATVGAGDEADEGPA